MIDKRTTSPVAARTSKFISMKSKHKHENSYSIFPFVFANYYASGFYFMVKVFSTIVNLMS